MAFRKKRDERAGLFDGLRGKGIDQTLEVPVAVMVPMVIMLWADQKKHESETAVIHSICDSSPIFLKPNSRQIDEWIDIAEAVIKEADGDEKACALAKAALSPPLRETAFAFSILVLFADEKVTSEEKVKGERLAEWLEIDKPLAGEIIKVVSILRHGRDTH